MCLPALLASNCLCAWARNGVAQVDGYFRYVIKALGPMVRKCRCVLCLRMRIPRALIRACGMLGCRMLLASQPFRSENAEFTAWKCRRLACQATVSRLGFVFDSKAITVTQKCKGVEICDDANVDCYAPAPGPKPDMDAAPAARTSQMTQSSGPDEMNSSAYSQPGMALASKPPRELISADGCTTEAS